jgi:quercetin dioxygenase-like cupin family protein
MTEPVAGTTASRYAWDTIEPDHPMAKATRRLVKGENAMVARFVLDEGLDVEPHVHHNEQITIVLEGRLLVRIGTIGSDEIREEVLGPGEVVAFPPFAPHGFQALERVVAFDVFSPPSDKTGIDQG